MQQCENCNRKFGFGQIFKSLWLAYKPIVCKHCNTVNEHTMKNRILTGLSIGIGGIIGGLFWALSESDKETKMLIVIVADVFFMLLLSTLVMFFFNFKKKKISAH